MKLDIFARALGVASLFSRDLTVPNLPNDKLMEWGETEATKIFDQDLSSCDKCRQALDLGKKFALKNRDLTPRLLVKLCQKYNFTADCDTWQGDVITRGGKGKHAANVMTLLDPYGDDGQAVCAEFVKIKGKAACKYPDTPKFDISSWWPAKPQNPNIPKSEGKTFNAAHVSDFHIDLRYTIGAEADCDKGMCCTPVVENKKAKAAGLSPLVPAQKQGTYKCDSPEVLLDKGMQSVGTLAAVKDFEFAIFTGDMVSHDLDEWLSFAHTFQSEEECYYLMKKHLKDVPMYPTFGNHDSYPYAQLAQNKSGYAGDFTWNAELSAALWQDFGWIDEETEKQAAHTYGSFAVTTKRGLRVISVDSNFWYKANLYNWWNISDPDPSGTFKWIVSELLECEKKGQKAWLLAHVPTGAAAAATPWSAEIMRQIIVRFSPHVLASVFYGHTHADQFTVYYDGESDKDIVSEESALQIGWIVQSLTPMNNYNPGWRYYEVDTKTFEIMDSRNYYTKLNETFDFDMRYGKNVTTNGFEHLEYPAHTPQNMTWEFEYSARDAYDPDHTWPKNAPLNGTFWHRAARNIVTRANQTQLYYDHYYRKSPFVKQDCDGKCVKNLYCSFVTSTNDQLARCKKLKEIPHME
ncbi:Metallo-dependent phosphatase-like protein [Yarrowia lipolytica]|jgi:sphingomyelin phosphodiesterase|uniref:Metallo-dependent phosphatase-like protein n=1 Tax=Yarrowia lipolytica TaxID=4952 RepID=A0A371CB42_YARLL|nr:Sphingomyelin phosphodiesterase 2 [Yarrowia lipolytica]RDW27521.1 Metallo-dependent phosphatase-like protein [Yarrowia lipolytica]RDW34384.1 Metallo-dependent phosphatase-like protein [Yarrowia lipolytica]RDW42185.1 Metallo-dependent phosphatase-like protein [Yarrowia lipolytica]RDW45141.1 Metallo-dependent phosphatase-like protein [Yarrowia lipolytica]